MSRKAVLRELRQSDAITRRKLAQVVANIDTLLRHCERIGLPKRATRYAQAAYDAKETAWDALYPQRHRGPSGMGSAYLTGMVADLDRAEEVVSRHLSGMSAPDELATLASACAWLLAMAAEVAPEKLRDAMDSLAGAVAEMAERMRRPKGDAMSMALELAGVLLPNDAARAA